MTSIRTRSAKTRVGASVIATLALGLGGLAIGAAPAAADTGLCGYYSESRAANTASNCYNRQVRSIVLVNPNKTYSYGPWVNNGSTSWQPYSYPAIEWYSYSTRLA